MGEEKVVSVVGDFEFEFMEGLKGFLLGGMVLGDEVLFEGCFGVEVLDFGL